MTALTMLPQDIEKSLARIESQLQTMAVAVERGEAELLEQTCAQVRQASAEFARLIQGRLELFSDPVAKRRLQRVLDGMAIQRSGLIRRSAQIERTLSVLMPSLAEASTYVQRAGRYRPATAGVRQYAA